MTKSFQTTGFRFIAMLVGVLCIGMSGCDSSDSHATAPSPLSSLSVSETQNLPGELIPSESLPGSLRPPAE